MLNCSSVFSALSHLLIGPGASCDQVQLAHCVWQNVAKTSVSLFTVSLNWCRAEFPNYLMEDIYANLKAQRYFLCIYFNRFLCSAHITPHYLIFSMWRDEINVDKVSQPTREINLDTWIRNSKKTKWGRSCCPCIVSMWYWVGRFYRYRDFILLVNTSWMCQEFEWTTSDNWHPGHCLIFAAILWLPKHSNSILEGLEHWNVAMNSNLAKTGCRNSSIISARATKAWFSLRRLLPHTGFIYECSFFCFGLKMTQLVEMS